MSEHTLPRQSDSHVVLPKRFEHWHIDRLRPYDKNPRTHSPEQITKLVASLREFGFTNPVLVDSHDGIVAGHGRLQAARAVGLTEVPVVILDHLTDAQRRAYIIADNRLALDAGWDEDLLAVELGALRDEDFDLSLAGFADDELDAIFATADSVLDGAVDEENVPAPPVTPVSRVGDMWTLGRHRLLCGDATKAEDVERLMAGKRASMAFTDPPYNVNYDGAAGKIENDNLRGAFAGFLKAALGNLLKVTDGAVYCCMSSSELDTLQHAFRQAGGHWSTFIIWAKNTFTLGRSDYQRQYEPILYGWPEKAKRHWCGDRNQADVWQIDKPVKNDLHPTMKPVVLVERAINNSSRAGNLVLDPFAGSGTTLIACERTARTARLLELDPRFVDVIVRRWEQFTGKQAVLEDGGQRFEHIAAERSAIAGSEDLAPDDEQSCQRRQDSSPDPAA